MAIDINIPSQVKEYADLASFPATGSVKTIYIAQDTNKTYRWTGSAYVEISATATTSWGGITGTLSNQTDLQSALNSKENTITSGTTSQYFRGDKTFQTLDKTAVGLSNVDNTSDVNKPISTATQTALNAKQDSLGFTPVPTTRTLTINGTALDLSADRSWTISTGITIGTTAITSGTIGRILFQGTGNVVSQSTNLFWDNTNGRFGINTSSPTAPIHVETSGLTTGLFITTGNDGGFTSQNNGTLATNRTSQIRVANGSTLFGANDRTYQIVNIGRSSTTADFYFQYWDGSTYNDRFRIFANGNVGIGTGGTDAGYKLDVNGTARISGATTITGNATINAGGVLSLNQNATNGFVSGGSNYLQVYNRNVVVGTVYSSGTEASFSWQIGYGLSLNVAPPNSTAILDLTSTTKGFLPPRMTTTQKNAISSPALGLVVFDTTLNKLCVKGASAWETITSL